MNFRDLLRSMSDERLLEMYHLGSTGQLAESFKERASTELERRVKERRGTPEKEE